MWPFGLHETKFLFVYLSFTTFFLGFLLLLKVLRRDLNLVKFSNSLPGPKGIPVIGNGLELLKFRGEGKLKPLFEVFIQTTKFLKFQFSVRKLTVFPLKLSRKMIFFRWYRFVSFKIHTNIRVCVQVMVWKYINGCAVRPTRFRGNLDTHNTEKYIYFAITDHKLKLFSNMEIVLFSKKTIRRPPTLADYADNSAITTNKSKS